jgi:two-component system, OmpR family, alkaline phosphatase synthesis response regulator PhoP
MYSILIVEDDRLLSKALMNNFTDGGYRVFTAINSEKAFEILEKESIDLIYLDIMLPGVNGYHILKQLKSETKYKNIPVVMLSNLGQMQEIEMAMELGATDYVVKANIDLDELLDLTKKKLSPQS